MEDKDYCFILSHKWFLDRKDLLTKFNKLWKAHIYIEDETGENYIVNLKMMTTL